MNGLLPEDLIAKGGPAHFQSVSNSLDHGSERSERQENRQKLMSPDKIFTHPAYGWIWIKPGHDRIVKRALFALICIFHSFTPPMVSPVTKYFCKNGYSKTIGIAVTTVIAARMDTGVTMLVTFLNESTLTVPPVRSQRITISSAHTARWSNSDFPPCTTWSQTRSSTDLQQ